MAGPPRSRCVLCLHMDPTQGGTSAGNTYRTCSQPLPHVLMAPSPDGRHWPSVASAVTRSSLHISFPAPSILEPPRQPPPPPPQQQPQHNMAPLSLSAANSAATAAEEGCNASAAPSAQCAKSCARGNSIGSSEASSSYQWSLLGCLSRAVTANEGQLSSIAAPKAPHSSGFRTGSAMCKPSSRHSLELLGLHDSLGCLSDEDEEEEEGGGGGADEDFVGMMMDGDEDVPVYGGGDGGCLRGSTAVARDGGIGEGVRDGKAQLPAEQLEQQQKQQLQETSAYVVPNFCMEIGKDLKVNEHHLLGFGTTGCVYAGQYTPSPGEAVPVAVKLMSDAYEARQMLFLDAHARSACQPLVDFRREALILARSIHPNIVRCYGGCLHQPRPFIVQELCAASLRDLMYDPFVSPQKLQQLCNCGLETNAERARNIGQGSGVGRLLPTRRVLEIARDVAAGLTYLHPRVLHRDVTCGNVLLAADGTAKLAGLGLSKVKAGHRDAQHEFSQGSQEVGTVAYCAPECFRVTCSRHRAKVTDKADVYSLGILMWELLMGCRPFCGLPAPALGVRMAVFGVRPDLPASSKLDLRPDCPRGLLPLLRACWVDEPGDRPSAYEVKAALEAMIAGMGPAESSGID